MPGEVSIDVRVRYAETDQMGVVYHANYFVWCDMARTEYLREAGASYRELEVTGLRLAVVEASARYRRPARFDEVVRVRCWVRSSESRRVAFGYAIERPADGQLLATAQTTLLALDSHHALTTIPREVRDRLVPTPDPVRL
ncbi:MAG TPA: thioesterase family protein [Gemmatimonadales bacterium]|jgi:acyl-CoA thioester hydrolase